MTDLSLTPANVIPGANANIRYGETAGGTIAAGEVVYREAASGTWKLADSDSGTEEVKAAGGIALNGAAAGQPLAVLTSGDITLGSVLTAGETYWLSETPGGIQPSGDLGGEDVVMLGIAKSATVLSVRIQIPGVTLAE